MKLFDYECKTTFWDDFTIAERFGEVAIIDTYRRAFREWKGNYIYITELVMVLNHKIWQWYSGDLFERNVHENIARTYNYLWQKAAEYAETHLKGEQLEYYFRVTD